MFYRSRYNILIQEIIDISKGEQDANIVTLTPPENSIMDVEFEMPRLSIEIQGEKSKYRQAESIFEIVIEQVRFEMKSQSKPVYSL